MRVLERLWRQIPGQLSPGRPVAAPGVQSACAMLFWPLRTAIANLCNAKLHERTRRGDCRRITAPRRRRPGRTAARAVGHGQHHHRHRRRHGDLPLIDDGLCERFIVCGSAGDLAAGRIDLLVWRGLLRRTGHHLSARRRRLRISFVRLRAAVRFSLRLGPADDRDQRQHRHHGLRLCRLRRTTLARGEPTCGLARHHSNRGSLAAQRGGSCRGEGRTKSAQLVEGARAGRCGNRRRMGRR